MGQKRYFVVQTHEYCEPTAKVHLLKQQFEVFFPTETVTRHHPRFINKTRQVIQALFPEYLFVRMDLSVDPWKKVSSTRGVKRILGTDCEHPTPVPEGFMEELIQRYDAGEFQPKAPGLLHQVGDMVRVHAGPLAGMAGLCVSSGVDRVRVLLSILGGERRVDLPPTSLVAA